MAGAERALKLSPLDPVRYFYDSLAATAALSAS
jgi:adenylate cyclase